MTDEEGLLRAICFSPDEDTPRLAYADWLDEHALPPRKCDHCNGTPRRQFFHGPTSTKWMTVGENAGVRVYQCLACWGAGEVPDESRAERAKYIRLAMRRADRDRITEALGEETEAERELLAAPHVSGKLNAMAWAAPLWDGVSPFFVKYGRGFVAEISLDTATFLQHAEAIFRAHPVTAVTLSDLGPLRSSEEEFDWVIAPPGAFSHGYRGCFVPAQLWALLLGYTLYSQSSRVKRYQSLGAATCALSEACVTFGRKLADLPPLGKAVAA
jgi:uncharacterized protein (TIGR02996 family)